MIRFFKDQLCFQFFMQIIKENFADEILSFLINKSNENNNSNNNFKKKS